MAMTQIELGGFVRDNIEAINNNFSDIQLNKADKTSIPTKVSQLTNDSDYQTAVQLANVIKNVSINDSTGIFTFTTYDGGSFEIDTLLEKVSVNFEFDEETQSLVITLQDGTKQSVPVSAIFKPYSGGSTTSGTISISRENVITFTLGSAAVTLDNLGSDVTAKLSSLESGLDTKVDQVPGKGLSSNDYTNEEKQKLAGLENYTLPVAGTSLGGIKNGGNVVVSPDGTANVSLPEPGSSAIKMEFSSSGAWTQNEEIASGYWFITLNTASQTQKSPLSVMRKNGTRYEEVMAMVTSEGDAITIGSLNKFDGYVVVI